MNKITKRSFYSFLTLYLVSSFIFLTLASYWFYTAQLSMEMNSNFNKMNAIANKVSSDVIFAHMMKTKFVLEPNAQVHIALFNKDEKLQFGALLCEVDFNKSYYKNDMTFSFVSKTVSGHLGLEYVVVQSNECVSNVQRLKNTIFYTALLVAVLIILISVVLSYIFLKPIKDKMQEIEAFIKDTTHELNTPISALMMSTFRVKEKKVYDENIITNISISTKQLYEIYASLTYINFDTSSEKAQDIDFDSALSTSIAYFDELLSKKNILLHLDIKPCKRNMAPNKAKMLINNLLSNAIKYSPPNKNIFISLDSDTFIIKDEGIGIATEKLGTVFERFKRASNYAGGFGVGLNIVESICKEYNYKVEITSQEHKGTRVKVSFRV